MALLLDFASPIAEAHASSCRLNSPYSKSGSGLDTSSLTPDISSPTPNTTTPCTPDVTTPAPDVTTDCKLRTNLAGHSGYVNNVTVSLDGSLCASDGQDVVAMLWDLAEGKRLYSLDSIARIPVKVLEDEFKKYFEKYNAIFDIYMPKESGSKSHKGIGFITFESSDSMTKVMAETHDLGGSTVAVDEATSKNKGGRSTSRSDSYERYHKGKYLLKYYDREYNGAYGVVKLAAVYTALLLLQLCTNSLAAKVGSSHNSKSPTETHEAPPRSGEKGKDQSNEVEKKETKNAVEASLQLLAPTPATAEEAAVEASLQLQAPTPATAEEAAVAASPLLALASAPETEEAAAAAAALAEAAASAPPPSLEEAAPATAEAAAAAAAAAFASSTPPPPAAPAPAPIAVTPTAVAAVMQPEPQPLPLQALPCPPTNTSCLPP
ncbi:hypothetical protein L7F22_028758 [Adiantum nelumboides]|nr:hypothetical protein [Adiantum nelumboides]